MANHIGKTFNRLTIQRQSGSRATALCTCGELFETSTYNITSGRAASCGCLRKELTAEKSTTHGQTYSPTWHSWANMKSRCRNLKAHNAANYAAKGITFTERWVHFKHFLADMGERPPGATLDRLDGSLGYSKENCRWADSREQWLNRNDPRVAVHLNRQYGSPE